MFCFIFLHLHARGRVGVYDPYHAIIDARTGRRAVEEDGIGVIDLYLPLGRIIEDGIDRMEAREEAFFVGLYQLEGYARIFVGGTNDAVVGGIETELDGVTHFGLNDVGCKAMSCLYRCQLADAMMLSYNLNRGVTDLGDIYCSSDRFPR